MDDEKYVRERGLVEVRTCYSNNPEDYELDLTVDLYDLVAPLPPDFCLKDKFTGKRQWFFCLVCGCELKSMVSLTAHISGQRHIRQTMAKKRAVSLKRCKDLDNDDESRLEKKRSRETQSNRSTKRLSSLKELLEDDPALPALGLEYINECISPCTGRRLYNCTLKGCKSAWGDSDNMFHHLVGRQMKHNTNYLLSKGITSAKQMYTRDALLALFVQQDKAKRGQDLERPRDYGLINTMVDEKKYLELKERPYDWSEAKANKDSAVTESLEALKTNIEKRLLKGNKNSVTVEAMRQYKFCLKTFSGNSVKVEQLSGLEALYDSVVDAEVFKVKWLREEIVQVKEEVYNFGGNKDSPEYNPLKGRIERLQKEAGSLQITDPVLVQAVHELMTSLEQMALPLSFILEDQLEETLDQIEASKAKFKGQTRQHIMACLQPYKVEKGDVEKLVQYITDAEMGNYKRKATKRLWSQLELTQHIKDNIAQYIKRKMNKKATEEKM